MKKLFVLAVAIIIVIITAVIGNATQRLKYTGIARSTGGAALATATVSIYLAGTTTEADVYEAASGGIAVNSVTSDEYGRWTFYADVADYPFTQAYKVVVTKDGYTTITLDNIYVLSLPTNAAGTLTNDGSGNYSWGTTFDEAGDYTPTGTWDFTGATVTGVAADTATALAANGANCSAGYYPLGVSAAGAAEDCTLAAVDTFAPATFNDIVSKWASGACTGYLKSDGTCNAGGGEGTVTTSGEVTENHLAAFAGATSIKDAGALIEDNSTTGNLVKKVCAGTPEVCTIEDAVSGTDYAAPNADTTGTASKIPSAASPTIDSAGKIGIDTTTDQLQYYGGAKRAIPSIQYASFVIPAPADTDDINVMKAPYGMSILGIDCIVQGTTSVTGQLQECTSTGTDCADLDSDITCDADGAADDGSLTDSTIASGAWLRWKTTSLSGTPTFLTVTFRYRVVAN